MTDQKEKRKKMGGKKYYRRVRDGDQMTNVNK